MADRLKNKTALITGGSRGIGRAVAEAYAAEGARIVLNARDRDRLDRTAEEIRAAYGVEVSSFACDVVDRDAVEAMVDQADAARPIDILVNNAGIHKASPFVDYAFEDFRNVIEVNVYGVLHVTQFVLRRMIARNSGVVVNIAVLRVGGLDPPLSPAGVRVRGLDGGHAARAGAGCDSRRRSCCATTHRTIDGTDVTRRPATLSDSRRPLMAARSKVRSEGTGRSPARRAASTSGLVPSASSRAAASWTGSV